MSKIYFQGTYGAYSHLASISIDPKAEILPCKTFDECFLKASSEEDSKIVIPESNRITGNIGIEYLIFKYRLNIYSEYFQRIEHNLIGQPGSKIEDIKDVFHHIGIYCYQVEVLKKFITLAQTKNELNNRLEQLRALDNNINIIVALAKKSPIGVDTEEDYLAIKKIMKYK